MGLMARSTPTLVARPLAFLLLLGAVAGAGCAKNVDKVEFRKWGHSFDAPAGGAPPGDNIDTTAQGGSSLGNGPVPESPNFKMPKASVGGAYHRTFSSSVNYRLMGGFHVTPGQ